MKPEITPERLLEELTSEALAHSLAQRQILKVFLVLKFSDDSGRVVEHTDPSALKEIKRLLSQGAIPAGVLALEQAQPTGYVWHQVSYYEGAGELIDRVRDDLVRIYTKKKSKKRK